MIGQRKTVVKFNNNETRVTRQRSLTMSETFPRFNYLTNDAHRMCRKNKKKIYAAATIYNCKYPCKTYVIITYLLSLERKLLLTALILYFMYFNIGKQISIFAILKRMRYTIDRRRTILAQK